MSWQERRAAELQEDREALDNPPPSLPNPFEGLAAVSPERVTELRAMDYRTGYLRSPEWRAQRAWLLAATGYRCGRCGRYQRHGLHAHHLTYANLGAEEPSDIVALCGSCHRREHQEIP